MLNGSVKILITVGYECWKGKVLVNLQIVTVAY